MRIFCFGIATMLFFLDPVAIQVQADDGISLGIVAEGTHAAPQRLFAENYSPAKSFSFGIAAAAVEDGVNTGSVALIYSRDKVRFKDSVIDLYGIGGDKEANLSSVYFVANASVTQIGLGPLALLPMYGVGFGGSRLSVPSEAYKKIGSTLSELGHENTRTQYSDFRRFGVLVSGRSHVSLGYYYDIMNVEKSFKFWHEIISGFIGGCLIELPPQLLAGAVYKKTGNVSSLGLDLLTLAYRIGATIYWYDLDYKKHNWPYDDSTPLRCQRQLLSLTFYF